MSNHDELLVGGSMFDLWQSKVAIAVAGLLFAAVAFAVMTYRQPQAVYESTAELAPQLVRMESEAADRDQAVGLAAYQAAFDRALTRWGVAKACGPIPGEAGTIARDAVGTTVQPHAGLAVAVRLPDPVRAATVANACADALVALADRMLRDNAELTASAQNLALDRFTEAGQRVAIARQAKADGRPATAADLVAVDRLEAEYDIARKVYVDAGIAAQANAMAASVPGRHLQRAINALPAADPIAGGRRWPITVLAGIAGLVIGALVILVIDALVARELRADRVARPPVA